MKNILKTAIFLSTAILLFSILVPSVEATNPDCTPPFRKLKGTFTSPSLCEQYFTDIGAQGYCCYESPVDGTVYGYSSCNWGKECLIGEQVGTCDPRGNCILEEDCNPFWNCSGWEPLTSEEDCGSTFIQARTCRDVYECGTEAGRPEEEREAVGIYCPGEQTCENEECVEFPVVGEEEEEKEEPPSSGIAGQGWTGRLEPPIKAKTFEALIDGIINFVFWIGVAIAPIMILIAGIMYMTAGGDPTKIGKARNLIIYTAIGFAIILFARGLIAVLESVMGVAD